VFKLLTSLGRLPDTEAYRVFNMGIGMVLAVDPQGAAEIAALITRLGCPARLVGEVVEGEAGVVVR